MEETFGPSFHEDLQIPFTEQLAREAWLTLSSMARRGVASPTASSAGRLFDAAAALIGLYRRVEYEAQAPMKLEAIAQRSAKAYAFDLHDEGDGLILDPTPTVREIVGDIRRGETQARIAGRFHATFVAMLAEAAERMARRTGIELVALSGGTFLNRIIIEDLMDELERRELRPIMHRATPAGDGCVSLGQAVVAQARWQ